LNSFTPALVAILIGVLVGCGPAVTDGRYQIAGAEGYFFVDAGGNEKVVARVLSTGQSKIIVSARVDAYIVQGTQIIVAQSPRVIESDGSGSLSGRIASICEYWAIDQSTGETQKIKKPSSDAPQCRSVDKSWIR
jgi:hypothetical protein